MEAVAGPEMAHESERLVGRLALRTEGTAASRQGPGHTHVGGTLAPRAGRRLGRERPPDGRRVPTSLSLVVRVGEGVGVMDQTPGTPEI